MDALAVLAVLVAALVIMLRHVMRIMPLTLRLLIVTAIGFILAFSDHASGILLGVVLVVVALALVAMPKTLRWLLLAVIGFALVAATEKDPSHSSEIFFWVGMSFGVLGLGFLPAAALGYEDFFLRRWQEESQEANAADEEYGESDGGD